MTSLLYSTNHSLGSTHLRSMKSIRSSSSCTACGEMFCSNSSDSHSQPCHLLMPRSISQSSSKKSKKKISLDMLTSLRRGAVVTFVTLWLLTPAHAKSGIEPIFRAIVTPYSKDDCIEMTAYSPKTIEDGMFAIPEIESG